MTLNRNFLLSLTGFCSLFVSAALARDPKPIVPTYVLRARTVAVWGVSSRMDISPNTAPGSETVLT